MKGPTDYTRLVCGRCNLDLQDLRRVLAKFAPLVLPSIGDRPDWSWMNDGGVVHELQPQVFPNEQTLLELALLEQNQKEERTLSFRAREELAEIFKLIQLMLMDTHNTNFYVNSYTTKMGVGMADFMKHLRAGIERLQQEISEEEARMASNARRLG